MTIKMRKIKQFHFDQKEYNMNNKKEMITSEENFV